MAVGLLDEGIDQTEIWERQGQRVSETCWQLLLFEKSIHPTDHLRVCGTKQCGQSGKVEPTGRNLWRRVTTV